METSATMTCIPADAELDSCLEQYHQQAQRFRESSRAASLSREKPQLEVACCLVPRVVPGHEVEARISQDFYAISRNQGTHEALSFLSYMLTFAIKFNEHWVAAQWAWLADLSKQEPSWRPLFGPLNRVGSQHSFGEGFGGNTRCILEAAALAVGQAVNDLLPSGVLRPVLRLIANCCADNNINRSLIINSPALEWLQTLIGKGAEVDVLLPTLYNVCVDYDEPATDTNGQAYRLSDQLEEAAIEVNNTSLSKAQAQLSMRRILEVDEKHFEACGIVLADLLELSSRSALFDISIILGRAVGGENFDDWERGSAFCNELLHKSTMIASTSDEAQAAICQICMNLLSEPSMQRALAQSPDAIQHFIELPYLTLAEVNEDIAVPIYREEFLRTIYTVSALPEYVKTHPPASAFLKSLAEEVARHLTIHEFRVGPTGSTLTSSVMPFMNNPSSIASVLVLINNALSDRSRVEAFLSAHEDICKHTNTILLQSHDEAVLLPALKLASRFAISSLGAQKLCSAQGPVWTLFRVFRVATSSTNNQRRYGLAIQYEVLSLARLLINGQPQITIKALKSGTISVLLEHSSITIDASYKLETARLCVEVLRNLASPKCSSSDARLIAGHVMDKDFLPLFVASLVFLLTNAPAPSAQSEALFGLGLFSSMFVSSAIPQHNLLANSALLRPIESDKEKVLLVLTRVAGMQDQSHGKADRENLKTFATHMLLASKQDNGSEPLQDDEFVLVKGTSPVIGDLEVIARDLGLHIAI